MAHTASSGDQGDQSEEFVAMSMMLSSFQKVMELDSPVREFTVGQGSSLAGDDAATGLETLSSQVDTLIQGVIDNVSTLHALIVEANVIPAYAHFGLLRNALEMVGTAFWLLGPTSRDVRVLRSLQLALESRKDYVNAANEVLRRPSKFPADDEVMRILETQRDSRVGLVGKSLNPPSITTRLRESDSYSVDLPYTILGFWRLASGAMHGRRETLMNILDHEILESGESGVRTSSSSGIVIVANMLRHIELHLFELAFLTLARSRPPI